MKNCRAEPWKRKLNSQQQYHQVLHNDFESESEIRDLQRRLESLQRKKNEMTFGRFRSGGPIGGRNRVFERKNDNLEHASIMTDCGTPSRPAKYSQGNYISVSHSIGKIGIRAEHFSSKSSCKLTTSLQ